METSTIVLTIVSFVCTGGLLGFVRYWRERDRPVYENALLVAQIEREHVGTELDRASVAKTKAETEHTTVDTLRLSLQELRSDIQRVRKDRDEWQERALALGIENERLIKESSTRHKLVNEIFVLKLRESFMEGGMSFEASKAKARLIKPPYPEAETE